MAIRDLNIYLDIKEKLFLLLDTYFLLQTQEKSNKLYLNIVKLVTPMSQEGRILHLMHQWTRWQKILQKSQLCQDLRKALEMHVSSCNKGERMSNRDNLWQMLILRNSNIDYLSSSALYGGNIINRWYSKKKEIHGPRRLENNGFMRSSIFFYYRIMWVFMLFCSYEWWICREDIGHIIILKRNFVYIEHLWMSSVYKITCMHILITIKLSC